MHEPHSAVSAVHLSHAYPGRQALADVEFDVGRREIFGLLGPNGGGKSTLFRILSTLMTPSRGRAYILGHDVVAESAAVRRHIGVVFQSASLDRKLTVRENLMHQGHLYGLRAGRLRSRIDHVLRGVGLEDRVSERVEKLSGGLARRVELAKGWLHEPDVLLLDEPTTGLDPGARRDFWKCLNALRQQAGATVLLTTHLMDDADRCDRLGILDQGRLVALDAPDALRNDIGGEVISIQSSAPQEIARHLREQFQIDPSVVEGTVRVQHDVSHKFVAELMDALQGRVDAVTVSKPTLEDVFIQRTGHRFWDEEHRGGNA